MQTNNAYVHMKYKLMNPTHGITQLGVMDLKTAYKRFMHSMYPQPEVEIALHQCARDGLMDCVWVIEGDKHFVEEDFNNFTTLKKIQNGDIFNEATGKKLDVSLVKMQWSVSQHVLHKVPNGSFTTLFDRMKRWLRFWERN